VAERVRIGTRGSPLALRQAQEVAARLRAAWPGLDVELVPIRTSGDRLATASLATVGGKGLFVKEIDDALLDGQVDLAVHSLKDLPAERPEGLTLAAFPPREDARDVLVGRAGETLGTLGAGARVGTSSLRREVQVLARRPDVRVLAVRGNVGTRLRKLAQGDFDALVLAAAGLRRLGLLTGAMTLLDPEEMLPAVGQGTLGVEARTGDQAIARLAVAIDDAATRRAALAERAFLAGLGGACTTPLAAHARPTPGGLRLDGFLGTPDARRALRDAVVGDPEAPALVGQRLAERFLSAGAAELLRPGRPP
jgi:hydroxymethylbilane synthase